MGSSADKTELINAFDDSRGDDGETVMIWNRNAGYQVVLTDVGSPMNSYQATLHQSIIVGRKRKFFPEIS